MQTNRGTLSNHMTVVALVNGMIGGVILVMPIMALKSGYLMIAPVVLISGFFSYYSCLLCIKHLKNYKDLDQAVLHHFDNRKGFKLFYDICISVSIIVLLILYFDLICKQWSGLTSESKIIPLINAIALFPVVYVMKKYHFGASLLAYGIISTIGYCIFLLYMWIMAPQGDKQLEPANKHFPELAAALSQGFAIQTFFIPIIRKNPNRHLYKKLILITYVIGTLIYAFIGYGGALSIVNKVYPGFERPETITQYFERDEWQVILLHIIYLVHLYSAFPQFLLISKKRLFSALNWPQPSDVSFKQVVYTAIIILLCLIIKLTSLTADTLIELNGSIVSFIFITVIPVSLHIKCVYFTKKEQQHQKWEDQPQNKAQVEMKQWKQESEDTQDKGNKANKEQNDVDKQCGPQSSKGVKSDQLKDLPHKNKTKTEQIMLSKVSQQSINDETKCCDVKYRSRMHQACDALLMIIMVGMGIATMVYTLYLIYSDYEQGL